MAVWDARALTTPIARETIDNAPGILLPFFDADTNMLFFAGKVLATAYLGPHLRARTYARAHQILVGSAAA